MYFSLLVMSHIHLHQYDLAHRNISSSLQAKGDGTGQCPFSTPLGKVGSAGIISNIGKIRCEHHTL